MPKVLLWLTIASFLLQIQHGAFSDAFLLSSEHSRTTSAHSRFLRPTVTPRSVHSQDEHGDFFDVEATRKKLESLVAGGDQTSLPQRPPVAKKEHKPAFSSFKVAPQTFASLPETPVLDVTLPPRSPLTTIERERRHAELELLSTLSQGDESLDNIWDLWFSERGSQAATLLHRADDLINDGPQGWNEAERILNELIAEHGVYFAEPLNRLATMYYLQGRLEEALTLNSMVLAVKPWHFGALSHIVMVYAALGDNQKARQWAAFRLPTFTPGATNRRRSQWAERAVAEAKIILDEGEKELSSIFGKPDDDWIDAQNVMNRMYEDDASAWQ